MEIKLNKKQILLLKECLDNKNRSLWFVALFDKSKEVKKEALKEAKENKELLKTIYKLIN